MATTMTSSSGLRAHILNIQRDRIHDVRVHDDIFLHDGRASPLSCKHSVESYFDSMRSVRT